MKGNSCVLAAKFGLGSWSVTFTYWEVCRARAMNIQLCRMADRTYRRHQRFCSMLMCDDFLLLFPRMPQVRTMHALPCSDLPCVYNSQQSSCVVVEEICGRGKNLFLD